MAEEPKVVKIKLLLSGDVRNVPVVEAEELVNNNHAILVRDKPETEKAVKGAPEKAS